MKSLLIVLTMALAVAAARAQQEPAWSIDVGSHSQYVWRGMVVTNGPVLQTSATLGYRGFHLNAFTSNDLTRVNDRRGKLSELDFDAGYDKAFEKTTLSGGVIRYTFPNTGAPSTTELYAGASFKAPLRPSARIYFDVGSIKGSYATFDASHGFALPKFHPGANWNAEFSAGLGVATSGYNQGYFGVNQSGFVDFHPTLALPVDLGAHFRVTPRLSYAFVLDGALRESATPKSHGFFFGLGVSMLY